jgi:serine/threonine protein kinase
LTGDPASAFVGIAGRAPIIHDNSLALTPLTRLGVYEVIAQIGEGGMGQVYRARDTKLHRNVALKVLPEAFANDPNRLARFRGEALTLASLNHPGIAHIHGFEESGGVRALVMERRGRGPVATRRARRDPHRRSVADCEADRRGARSGA